MYRVLIVDDEPYFSEGLKNLIKWEEFGLEVYSVAYDGEEALKIIENVRIHVLITDIKMPKMHGIQLIDYIRSKKLDIRCIVLSGYDDFKYVKAAAVLGIENYFLKPINEEELSVYQFIRTQRGL